MPATRATPRTGLDNATVLVVDDEPAALSSLRRTLRGSCVLYTAASGAEALELAAELPDLAVVLSDMRMPGMDGAALFKQLRTLAPDAVRVLLTGYADVEAAVAAINDGAIFRFLWKPVEPEALKSVLGDAVGQHQLLTAERELLEQTLRGSVRALLETLSLANPRAFSRAERIRARVDTILARLDVPEVWDIQIAAMLSQLGAVTLPPVVVESLHAGDRLTPHVQEQVNRVPTISADLLAGVPRMEEVRRAIRFQDQRFDGRGPVSRDVAGADIPLGARVLRVALDYDTLEARGDSVGEALTTLRNQRGRYDPDVLEALELAVTTDEDALPVEQLGLGDLRAGMVLAADLVAEGDVLLCGRGQEVTERMIQRLQNWAEHYRIVEPILVHLEESGV